jgi:hypothetical protein
MDENLFGMSIDDINTDKSVNLSKEYHFPTIDDDLTELEKQKSERRASSVDSDYEIK